MKVYTLRVPDDDLWQNFKLVAAIENQPLSRFFIKAMEALIRERLSDGEFQERARGFLEEDRATAAARAAEAEQRLDRFEKLSPAARTKAS